MGCKLCEEMLMEYLYGELDEESSVRMKQHLSASEPCRKEYRDIQSMLDMAGEAAAEDLPLGLHTRIMAHAAEHHGRLPQRPGWARLFRPALTTAVVMVIATGVYFHSARVRGPLEVKQRIESEGSSSKLPGPFHMARTLDAETGRSLIKDQNDLHQEESLEEEAAFGLERLGQGPAGEIGQGRGKGISSPAPVPDVPKKRKAAASKVYRPMVSVADQRARDETVPAEKKLGFAPTDIREKDDFSLAPAPQTETKRRMVPEWKEESGVSGKEQEAVRELFKDGKTDPTEGTGGVGLKMLGTATNSSGARVLPDKIHRTSSFPQEFLVQDAELPAPLAEAVELARSGLCDKALEGVKHDAARDGKDTVTGLVWLELADCFLKKGDNEKAGKMASKALEIPACSRRAEAFLKRMGALPEPTRSGK